MRTSISERDRGAFPGLASALVVLSLKTQGACVWCVLRLSSACVWCVGGGGGGGVLNCSMLR